MIVVANRIPVKPEYAAAFEERFKARAHQVENMPGFVAFQLLRPTKEGDPYIVMTTWESQAHFEQWTQSEEFQRGHGGTLPKEAYTARPTLEVHEMILHGK